MPVLILDPYLEQRIRTERDDAKVNRYDEVWEGVLVVAPLPNNDHQVIVSKLNSAFSNVIDWDQGSQVVPGTNVSDRDAEWLSNYREPDIAVYLATNPAKNSGTHWVGGPDLAVEIVSPGEDPHDKLDFYAKVNTREVLIVDRSPWMLELYQLQGGKLILAGKSEVANAAVLASGVLPIAFQLQAGTPRPTILLTHSGTKQTWMV
ncbi:MAG TPA: Uma2 family endonuclease [Gemmata sp.]|jgi:Uma2 family endonuclease|nr:Uma2 family endonuclease [Gemmata sp.]